MKIIGFKAENVKRIKLVELTPNEFINRISGPNGSGKTSILDAIEWALCGTSNVAKQPVRKGSGRAYVILDTEEYTITRRWTEGGNKNGVLTLVPKDDKNKSKVMGPQEVLDKLMGKISFDPLEFLRMDAAKQLAVLKSLIKFDVDFDINRKHEHEPDYIRRREAKKERDAVIIRRDAVYVAPDLPKTKVDEESLVKQLREASDYNSGIEMEERDRRDFSMNIATLSSDIDAQMDRVTELRRQADELQAEADVWAKQLEKNEKTREKWKPLPELRNATELAEQITKARTINQGIDRRTLRESYDKEAETLDAEMEALDAALDKLKAAKSEALAKAEFPVPGLAFGDDEVIYRGFPFGQVSNAEQIRCSVAIGMATNPELRVMRIKDGSLLDKDAMTILAEMAKAHDTQVWVEVVDTSGKVGVYLEDGEVSAVNEEPLNQPKAAKPAAAPKKRTKIQATA